jgi:hypothetical protein
MRAVLLYKDAVANLLDLEENVDPEQDEDVGVTSQMLHEQYAIAEDTVYGHSYG